MSKKASIVVSDGVKNIARVVDANSAVKIKAKSGVKYLLKGEHDDEGPENVTVTRVGDDLHVNLEGDSSPAVVLEGYYALPDAPGLYGVAEDGQLYAYVRTDGGGAIFSLADGAMEPVALGGDSFGSGAPYLALSESNDGFGVFWPLMLMGGLAGLGFAAVNSNRGSSFFVPPDDKRPVAPPQKPGSDALSAVLDDVGSIQGPVANGGVTDDSQPEFLGSGTPGNTITIYDNGNPIGSSLVGDDGHWHFTPPNDGGLTDGKHSITVTETGEGGESEHSDPFEFTVDTEAPGKPGFGEGEGFEGAIDDVGSVTGPIAKGGATDDTRPEFHGKGEPGSTIVIEDNGQSIGSAIVNEDGKWSFTPEEDLDEGDHSIVIIETDRAGNKSDPSDPYEFTVDTTPPGKPELGDGLKDAIDDVGAITGPIADGSVTDDARPEFNGTGEPGSTIVIYDNDQEIGTAEVDKEGNWSFTPPENLEDGSHSIVITETDKAGNTSEPSDPYEFSVMTPLNDPLVPELVAAMHIDLSALGLQGVEKFDLGIGGNTLTLGAEDVLANGQKDLVLTDGKTQMVVSGANGEVGLLGGTSGSDGWTSTGETEVDGMTYNVYANLAGTTELLVENKVQVTIL